MSETGQSFVTLRTINLSLSSLCQTCLAGITSPRSTIYPTRPLLPARRYYNFYELIFCTIGALTPPSFPTDSRTKQRRSMQTHSSKAMQLPPHNYFGLMYDHHLANCCHCFQIALSLSPRLLFSCMMCFNTRSTVVMSISITRWQVRALRGHPQHASEVVLKCVERVASFTFHFFRHSSPRVLSADSVLSLQTSSSSHIG
jgi:hypothetical protein